MIEARDDLIDVIDSVTCPEYRRAVKGMTSKVNRPVSKAVPCPKRADSVSKTIRAARIARYTERARRKLPLFSEGTCKEEPSSKS